jgi:hypothetical protein
MFKRLSGATLLLALWLSIVPAPPAGAETRGTLTYDAAAAVAQYTGETGAVEAEAFAAYDQAGTSGGSDDIAGANLHSAGPATAVSLAGHELPPPTGPPASTSTGYFQARAPPLF